MKEFRWLLAAVTVCLFAAGSLQAEGWADWWPLGKKEAERAPAAKPKSGLQWPKLQVPSLLPKKEAKPAPRIAPARPSTVDRLSSGTRKMWDGTTSLFTPDRPNESRIRAASTRKKVEKPTLWKRWFGARDEPSGPRSVKEWMAQDRLDP